MKRRIAVLFGGPTGEHDVSCASAASVVQHLDRDRFEVTPVRVTRSGVWVIGKDDPDVAVVDVPALLQMTGNSNDAQDGEPGPATVALSIAAAIEKLCDLDVALPAFHGPYGEDGKVQALLELIGVPYIGSGVAASAVGMDKQWTKTLLTSAGLTVTEGVVLDGLKSSLDDEDRARLGLPVFVKPAREGSSIGVSRVNDWSELEQALEAAHGSDHKVLIERAMLGREVDIGVLERADGQLVCGPPLEIVVRMPGRFFDYEAKYQHGADSELRVPADLDPAVTAALHEHAIRAFRALGCSGLLRVDFFLREVAVADGTDGTGVGILCSDGRRLEPVLNEVNTFPGFTAVSQYPQIWAAAGLSYRELLTTLVETTLASR